MTRRTLAIILVVLALIIGIITPVLAFTPVGAHLLNGLAQDAPMASPSPTRIPLTPTPKPTPILTARGKPPAISATVAILLDNDTGHILDDLNGEKPLPMASTTKIMTALIVIQTANLDQVVTIHQDAIDEVNLRNGSSAQLVLGDQITLKDLLYALLLPSGDDAAIAIADAVGGSTDNFVNTMNLFAHRLHLYQTHYSNPDGLTAPGHYTTAYDLVRLARYAMTISLFAQIVQMQHYALPPAAHHNGYMRDTTNTLLASYPGMTGIKTGWTPEAGGCLVFSATRNGHHLIGVVLHSLDQVYRFTDAKILLNWGFGLPLLPPSP